MKQMPEQMPGLLAKMDDPWGITWRAVNAFKRFSLRRAARFLSAFARGVEYERPVFIIGASRSGTTMLFHLLRESDELAGMPREGHDMWRTFHHPRKTGWQSDFVGPGEVRRGERRFVNAYIYSYSNTDASRFVEKTPENALRIPYLIELFPDAIFIVLRRNPCDVINSLINGWRHPAGRFRSYFVPEDLSIPGYANRRQWCFALIKGWRDLTSAPVPEIAFEQWRQFVEAIRAGSELIPPDQWLEVSFEDMTQRPDETMARIYGAIGIENTPVLEQKLGELLANPVNALTAPAPNKWKDQNQQEIMQLMPKIEPVALACGYDINLDSPT